MMNPSYPAGSESSGTPAPSARYRRRLLGSERITASGTWAKATALGAAFLAGIPPASLEVDLEAIGGGGSGNPNSTGGTAGGGRPGYVARSPGHSLDSLPATVTASIGAGAPAVTSLPAPDGGGTTFGDLLFAPGGTGGLSSSQSVFPVPEDPAPGAGAGGFAATARAGQDSSFAFPARRRLGGGSPGNPNVDGVGSPGQSARDAYEYGAGGGSGTGTGGHGGAGGDPGGGGGAKTTSGALSGAGGRGEVRLHYYIWEPLS